MSKKFCILPKKNISPSNHKTIIYYIIIYLFSNKNEAYSNQMDPEPKKKSNSDSEISEICFSTFVYLTFLILFWYFSSNPKHYGGNPDSCITLLEMAKKMCSLYFAGLLLSVVFIPLCLILTTFCKDQPSCIASTYLFIKGLQVSFAIVNLVFFVMLWNAYSKGEACGDLRTLTFIYLLLVGIGLVVLAIVSCCCLCCACCLGGAFLSLSSLGSQASYGAVNGGNNEGEA